MTIILIFLTLIYLFIDKWLARGLTKIQLHHHEHQPRVSVLLCARNEEDSIAQCIEAILKQQYPSTKWELLMANDRSEDQTAQIMAKYASEHPNLKVFHMPAAPTGISPKKNALATLIQQAKGDLILTTDADCLVQPQWIDSVVKQFKPGVDMVVGFSSFGYDPCTSNAFIGLQSLEFLSHFVVSSAAISNQLPINSSGNNLAYRKSTFEKLKGFDGVSHITSGDDDLLLHKFARNNPRSIQFNTNPGSFVLTEAQPTLRGLWEQRKRWASKTVYYNGKVVLLLSSVFLFYLVTFISLFAPLWGNMLFFYTGCLAFMIKTLLDFWVVQRGAKIFHQEELLRFFIPTALLHIPLIVGAVVFGIFGRFDWKGRDSSRS